MHNPSVCQQKSGVRQKEQSEPCDSAHAHQKSRLELRRVQYDGGGVETESWGEGCKGYVLDRRGYVILVNKHNWKGKQHQQIRREVFDDKSDGEKQQEKDSYESELRILCGVHFSVEQGPPHL